MERRPLAGRRLICFPHAGGSPFAFRGWGQAVEDCEVHTVCYPGRAERISEAPPHDLRAVAEEVAAEIRGSADDRPTAFFGHSMGAAVAFETALALEGTGMALAHFFASGARAPHLMVPAADPARTWDDASVRAALLALGGTDAGLLDNPVFREVMMPYIRADFRMLAAYGPGKDARLDCPVTALVGEEDPRVTPDQAAQWHAATRAGFALHTVAGGHFYLADAAPFGFVGGPWTRGADVDPGTSLPTG
ncbi:thioesterase II family protein [Streptomyces sp. NPDC059166]|uniref:thioesterase II family protein n=1 Tax=Streptomyces sp. NPDC059166 TaxID=3346752 RepID=UPI003694BF85